MRFLLLRHPPCRAPKFAQDHQTPPNHHIRIVQKLLMQGKLRNVLWILLTHSIGAMMFHRNGKDKVVQMAKDCVLALHPQEIALEGINVTLAMIVMPGCSIREMFVLIFLIKENVNEVLTASSATAYLRTGLVSLGKQDLLGQYLIST